MEFYRTILPPIKEYNCSIYKVMIRCIIVNKGTKLHYNYKLINILKKRYSKWITPKYSRNQAHYLGNHILYRLVYYCFIIWPFIQVTFWEIEFSESPISIWKGLHCLYPLNYINEHNALIWVYLYDYNYHYGFLGYSKPIRQGQHLTY